MSLQDQNTDTQKEMYEAQEEGSTGDASGGSSLLTPCHLAFSLQTAGRSLLKSLGGLCFVVVAGANYLTTHPLNYKISIEDPDCTRNIK